MQIYNSTKAFTEFLNNMQFSSTYVDPGFPLKVEGTIQAHGGAAIEQLIGAASVGNKAIGFFNRIPKVTATRPLRGLCLLIGTEMVRDTDLPTFFCKTPASLPLLLPKAIKTGVDSCTPVRVIVSANALNNYTESAFPVGDHDRVSPYLHPKTYGENWSYGLWYDKLKASYENLGDMPSAPLPENIAFNLPFEAFPEYIFPIDLPAQKAAFAKLKKINTTANDEPFINSVVHNLLRMDIEVKPVLEEEAISTDIFLCPGCPFAALYNNIAMGDYTVFSSIPCKAIYALYNILPVTIDEYMGITSKPLSLPTVFIGNASQTTPVMLQQNKNGLMILLKDTDTKLPFPYISAPQKVKSVKNMVFPYSCDNIKTYKLIKINPKKCTCAKENAYACITASHCPALFINETKMAVNAKLCTGCRSCVALCNKKAIS